MRIMQRQKLMSVLALSDLKDIKRHWNDSVDNCSFKFLRKPEIGMVMAVGRVGSTGEPFNVGEITVTRCALKLDCGIVGVGYLRGRNEEHATIMALIDGLAQKHQASEKIADKNRYLKLADILQKVLSQKKQAKRRVVEPSKVDFFTMVRGED